MSIENLRLYLTNGDIQAGMALLNDPGYQSRVSSIVRTLTRPCREEFDDAMGDARMHVLEQVRFKKFFKPCLKRIFREQGGAIEANGDGHTERWLVSELTQTYAIRLGQIISPCYEQFCCDEIESNHPLRITLLNVILTDNDLCAQKLHEFYIWASTVAQNRVYSYLRRNRNYLSALYSSRDISGLEEIADRVNLWSEIEQQETVEFIISLIKKIDADHPRDRLLDLSQRLREKIEQKQIANEFGISESSVTKRKKKLQRLLINELESWQQSGNAFVEIELPASRQRTKRTNETW